MMQVASHVTTPCSRVGEESVRNRERMMSRSQRYSRIEARLEGVFDNAVMVVEENHG